MITAIKRVAIRAALVLIGMIVVVSLVSRNISRMDEMNRNKNAKQEAVAKAKQQEWEDGWKRWLEESKKKNEERANEPREPGFDDGFRMGFMDGKLTRSKTNISPSSQQIESLAIEQSEKQQTPADARAGFVRGFTAGWSFGWTSK